jgi:hypothetical protein
MVAAIFAAAALASPASHAQATNPLARGPWGAVSSGPIDGAWNGADIERRTACTNPQNEGERGTYGEFDVSTNPQARLLGITQLGITGLRCTYSGGYSGAGPTLAWSGTYSCTDGKHGTFASRAIAVTANSLTVHLDVKLDTTESCTIEKVIAAGRLYP